MTYKSEEKNKIEEFVTDAPEVQKPVKAQMRVETYLHITGVKEHEKGGLIMFATKFCKETYLSFGEWQEFFKKY